MKSKDLAILGMTAIIAAILSFVLSGALFGSPKKNPVKVPDVTTISSTFPDVSHESDYQNIFNDKALDPTQLIQIGNNNNQTPFKTNPNQ